MTTHDPGEEVGKPGLQIWRGWTAGQASPLLSPGNAHLGYQFCEMGSCAMTPARLGGPAIRAPESIRKDSDPDPCQYVSPISRQRATSLCEVTPNAHASPLHFTVIPTPATRWREGTRDFAKRRNDLLDQFTAGLDLRT